MKPNWRRLLHAQWRDARVLLHESRAALVLFAAFALIFFQPVLPFPEQWPRQMFYFVVPILGPAARAGARPDRSPRFVRSIRQAQIQFALCADAGVHSDQGARV